MQDIQYSMVVAEDEDLIRSGLIRKIEQSRQSFSVVGEATHGEEALELVRRLQPQVLVTDIRMPVMDGLKLIEEVHNYYPRTAIVIASGYADFEYARQAMKFNVKHYLLKPFKQQDLADVLDDVRAQLSREPIVEVNDIEKTVQRIQQYLREHFHEEISLEQLSKQFSFSSAYLSKVFLKHVGEAPSKYIATLRINEAKRLLKQRKDLPVKAVGEQVGYADPFYFSRIFKQATGMTPREYQK
ncbi:response regulator transcription factor [Cohnella hashimotonis]|uniref:Response regulator n=1 Tax=Cohnella hashimotonis TaxID=2826895 RepID=A0ABT6TD00_9BACL|nr:response regulator [Cohnella hashimotonis]MDI4644707.1 response regulator [Cohnella hashimotonis]